MTDAPPLVDLSHRSSVASSSASSLPLNLQRGSSATSLSTYRSRYTTANQSSEDDDVFGLKSLSSRGSSSQISSITGVAAAVLEGTLVQIGAERAPSFGSDSVFLSSEESAFTDWDRLKNEAHAIAGGIKREQQGATPNRDKMLNLDSFSPLVSDSPLFLSAGKEPYDLLVASSPGNSPLKPLRLKLGKKDEREVTDSEAIEVEACCVVEEKEACEVKVKEEAAPVGDLIQIDNDVEKENAQPPKYCSCGGTAKEEAAKPETLLDLSFDDGFAPLMFGDSEKKTTINQNEVVQSRYQTPSKTRVSLVQRQPATLTTSVQKRKPLIPSNQQYQNRRTPQNEKTRTSLANRRSLLPPAKREDPLPTYAKRVAGALPATPTRNPVAATPNRRSLLMPSTPMSSAAPRPPLGSQLKRRSFLPTTPSKLATPARPAATPSYAASSSTVKMSTMMQHSGVKSRELFRPKNGVRTGAAASTPMVATQRYTASSSSAATPMRALTTAGAAAKGSAAKPMAARRRSGLPSPIKRQPL